MYCHCPSFVGAHTCTKAGMIIDNSNNLAGFETTLRIKPWDDHNRFANRKLLFFCGTSLFLVWIPGGAELLVRSTTVSSTNNGCMKSSSYFQRERETHKLEGKSVKRLIELHFRVPQNHRPTPPQADINSISTIQRIGRTRCKIYR